MTPEEKLQEAAEKSFSDTYACEQDLYHIMDEVNDAFIRGAKSEEAAVYHKEKNKWYTEEEVKELFDKFRMFRNIESDLSIYHTNQWFEQNKKK